MKFFFSGLMVAVLSLSAFAANVRFINYTAYDVVGLYSTRSSTAGWGNDLLGTYTTVGSNEYFDFTTNYNYTNYDFKIVDEDARECIIRNVYMNQNIELHYEVNSYGRLICHVEK
jgi:hypothetical protein